MSESPAKRRRIHPPESELDAGNATEHAGGQPTTPTRASYLSPTKSSLSRSHPHLVGRKSRSDLIGSRGRSLRDDILDTVSSGAEATEAISLSQEQDDRPVHELGPARADGTRQHQRPSTLYKEYGTEDVANTSIKPQLPVKEQPSMRPESSRTRRISEEILPPPIVPALVRRGEMKVTGRPPPSHGEEPELPPTPVALGLSPVPARPRGLASSSSPRRSVSGSGRFRRRTRADGPATSSPLKRRAQSPAVAGDKAMLVGQGEVAGTQESEAHIQRDEDLPQELKARKSTLRSLREELQLLKTQNERLETLIDTAEEVNSEDLSLLGKAYLAPGSLEHDLTQFGDKALSYLRLFAPSSVQLSYRTEAKRIQGRTKAIHHLTLTAPPPWLPGAFGCRFEVITDTEAVRIEHVRLGDMMTDNRRTESAMMGLPKWVHDRLEDALHCLDVGGMICGAGKYFAATIERARVFQQLHRLYTAATSGSSNTVWEGQDEEFTRDDAIELSRWLDKTQFRLPDTTSSSNSGSSDPTPDIMLVWDIGLDWTGCIISNVTIAVSRVSGQAEARLKELFHSLLSSRGVAGAFQSVWTMACGNGQDDSVVEKHIGQRKRS